MKNNKFDFKSVLQYTDIDGVLAIERFMKAFMSIPEEALDAYVACPSCGKLHKINLSSMVDKKLIIHCNECKNFFLAYYYFENGNRYILTKLFDHYELMPEEADRKMYEHVFATVSPEDIELVMGIIAKMNPESAKSIDEFKAIYEKFYTKKEEE